MKRENALNFTGVFSAMSNGSFRDEVDKELGDFSRELHDRADNARRAVRGKIVIELNVEIEPNGLMAIEPNVTTKLPKKNRELSSFWMSDKGIVLNNPRQGDLYGRLMEHEGGRSEMREVGGRSVVETA